MIQLVKLGNCLHLFDDEARRYVKCSATNLKKGLKQSNSSSTRRELLRKLTWKPCQAANCKVKKCQQGEHFIGSN